MSWLSDFATNPDTALTAANAILQSTLVLVVGWLLLKIARPRSAILRRGFLMLILLSLLLLPAVKLAFDTNDINWTILPIDAELVHEDSRRNTFTSEEEIASDQLMTQTQPKPLVSPDSQDSKTEKASQSIASENNEDRKATSNIVVALNFFLGIWVIGTSIVLLRIVYGTLLLFRFRRGLAEISDTRIQNVMAKIPEKLLRGTSPTICTSESVGFPLTVGVVRPIVIIPRDLYSSISDDELLAVATHELAHLAQRDLLVGFLQRLLGALYWWNPLVYVTNQSLSAAMEDVCDNFAIATLNDRTKYAECLTNIVEKTTPVCSLPGSVAMSQSRGSLERRVETIMWRRRDMRTESKRATKFVLAVLFVVITGLAAGSKISILTGNSGALSVNFKTEEVAPEYFDGWTFNWKFPSCKSTAKLGFVVFDPAGNECYRKPTKMNKSRGWVRSDFQEGSFDGNPAMFFDKHISFRFEISEGPMKFPVSHGHYFTFYKKEKNGKINWHKPIKKIKAVADEEELKRAAEGQLSYGNTITFMTKSKAPKRFDGWTFNWQGPLVLKSADVDYVLIDPKGKECYSHDIRGVPGGAPMRSSFARGFAGGDHTMFFNKHIKLKVRVSEGPLRFPPKHGFRFDFHKKGKDGKVDWNNAFATIEAVADSKELEKAGVIPADIDLNELGMTKSGRQSSTSRRPDLHWESVKLFQQGKYDQCIKNLETVVVEEPKRNWSWYLLGRSRYETGDYEGALKTFSHLVQLCEKKPYSRYNYEKGRTLSKLGRVKDAAEEFKKALENLDEERGYKSFAYSDKTIEGKKARTKNEVIKILKSEAE